MALTVRAKCRTSQRGFGAGKRQSKQRGGGGRRQTAPPSRGANIQGESGLSARVINLMSAQTTGTHRLSSQTKFG